MLGVVLLNRTFQTGKANEALSSIDEAGLLKIRTFPVAGMPFERLKDSEAELKRAIEHKLLDRPKSASTTEAGDPHNDEFNDEYWNRLFHLFIAGTRFQNAWSFLSSAIGECIDHALQSDRSIKKVIDFGAYCAYPLYQLSGRYPHVDFVGVDRDKSTKRFNELAFGHVENLSFHAKHVQELLPHNRPEDSTLLFHSRTGTLIYPEKLKEIYRDCAKSGIRYIALYENFALSRTEMKYFDIKDLPADAIMYGSLMFIHNYQKYLEEAGYEVIFEKRFSYTDLSWDGTEGLLGDCHGHMLARLR